MARNSKENAIQILDLKARKATVLPDSADLFSPRWSPDGSHLLAMTGNYAKLRLYTFSTGKWEDLLDAAFELSRLGTRWEVRLLQQCFRQVLAGI